MPRYFAKFTGSQSSKENQWFHFASNNYVNGSAEEKIHTVKTKIFNLYLKIIKLR
jgi:hypothetical protein